MYEEQEQEKRNRGIGVTWWVRYAFVPVAVALIAGISAVRAADLLKPTPEIVPLITVVPTQAQIAAPTQPESPPAAETAIPQPTNLPTSTPDIQETPLPMQTEAPTEVSEIIEPTAAADGSLGVHIVQRGEHLYCIGRGYGVPPQAIAKANHLSNPSSLRAGQRLLIPAVAWRNIPYGPVCPGQFASPYSRKMVYVPRYQPAAPAAPLANPAPVQTEISPPTGDEIATEQPVETAPPTDEPIEIIVTEQPPVNSLPPYPQPEITQPPPEG